MTLRRPRRGDHACVARLLHRQLDDHARADAFQRGNRDFAAVRLDDLSDNVETEAGAAAAAERFVAALLVLLPDLGDLLGLDAHAAVGDGDDDRFRHIGGAHDLRTDGNQAFLRRELQRIRDEVDDRLRQLLNAADYLRHIAAVRAHEEDLVARRDLLQTSHGALENAGETHRLLFDDQAARFDLREVEQLVDEAHHPLGFALRFLQQVEVHGVELVGLLAEHELQRSLDSRQRTAEIVDDLRGEVGFRLLHLPLLGDVLEPQRDALRGVAFDVHDVLDTECAALDLDVDGAVLVAVHEKVLKPSALAADNARAFLEPVLRVATERELEGVVVPLDAAGFVHDGHRSR